MRGLACFGFFPGLAGISFKKFQDMLDQKSIGYLGGLLGRDRSVFGRLDSLRRLAEGILEVRKLNAMLCIKGRHFSSGERLLMKRRQHADAGAFKRAIQNFSKSA
jgi:hypothetical protein